MTLDSVSHMMLGDVLINRRFSATFEKKILHYELSRQSLERLVEVRSRYFDALSPSSSD